MGEDWREIRTSHLVIRLFIPDHAESLWLNVYRPPLDLQFMRRPNNVADLRGWIADYDQALEPKCTLGYTAFLGEDAIALATVKLNDTEQRMKGTRRDLVRTFEYEVSVGEPFRGNRYAGEIGRGIFEAHDALNPIGQQLVRIHHQNGPSQQAAERAGFRPAEHYEIDVKREVWFLWHDRPMPEPTDDEG